jgi:hypothetical protein
MALIFEGSTPCAICGETIKKGDRVVSTSAFIADAGDPLWPFSDAAMQRGCFLAWESRAAFVARYNETHKSRVAGNGTYFRMDDDGRIQTLPADS